MLPISFNPDQAIDKRESDEPVGHKGFSSSSAYLHLGMPRRSAILSVSTCSSSSTQPNAQSGFKIDKSLYFQQI